MPEGRSVRRLLLVAACMVVVALGGCDVTISPSSLASATGQPTAISTPPSTPTSAPSSTASPSPSITPMPSAIVAEDLHAGSSGWRMGGAGYQLGTDIGLQVKGYASQASVNVGEPLTLFVTVSPAQQFKIDIYRLGWYGGSGGRLVVGGTWLPGVTQPACPIDWSTGLRICDWQPTIRFTVPSNWVSGLYLAVLTNADHFQNGIQFVVRDDASTAPILYVQPVTTYQAYNQFPNDGIGQSLYEGAVKVSFDRPYANSGVGKQFFQFDQPFVAWLERAGYQVSYATSIDLHRQGAALLRHHRVMVIAGHDEYWTAEMRAAATTALDQGTSLALFAANNMYWQARLEPASDGQPDRVLVCYRSAALDPDPNPALKTVLWRDPPVNRPEQALLGTGYTNPVAGRAAWVVADAGSWVYNGTGLSNGELIPGLVYGESDRPPSSPVPGMYPSVEVLSDSPFRTWYGEIDRSQAVLYQAATGGWVFDAGTFGWPAKIDPFRQPDPRVEEMTRNLLDGMMSAMAARS